MEIKPKLNIKSGKLYGGTVSTHTIRAVFDWDTTGGTHNYLRAKIKLSGYDCDYHEKESGWVYDGHAEVSETTELAGSYSIDIHTQGNNYPTDLSWFDMGFSGTYSLYIDGQKIDNPPTTIRPWRAEPVLKLSKTGLCPLDSTDYEIGDTSNTCGNIQWSALSDQITLSVIQGAQYVSFYNVSGQNLGKTISELEENINKYQLKYDNPNTATNKDEKIILEVTVNGISTRDTLIVYPKSNNYFVNGEIKDNVQRIVENEKLTMQAWLESGGTCGGKIESSDSTTTYTAEIIQGAEYGELLNPKNDAKGDSLGGIVAENDKISIDFYANGTIPASDKEIKVRISNSKENTQPLELSFLVGPSDVVVTFEPKELAAGDTANVIIKHRKEDGTLENFPNDQDYEVRLIEGSKYGTLLSSNGVDTSDYFESVSDGIKFIAYDHIDTNNVEVRLKISTYYFPPLAVQKSGNKGNSNVNGVAFVEQIYGIGKATVNKITDSLDHFEITIIPDTISSKDTLAFTEMAALKILAKDSSDNNVKLDSTKLLTFKILTNKKYGTFVKPNGDTLTTTPTKPVILDSISYKDAKDGKVKFAAVKENPDSVVNCNIKVILQEDTTKSGEHEAVVLEQTLKIVMDEPYTVWPTYFNRYNNRIIPVDSSKKSFYVVMTRGKKTIPEYRFQLVKEFVDSSGYHYHENERDENYGNLGYFMVENDTNHYHVIIDSTDASGRYENVSYFASMFGDTVKIKLNSLSNKLIKDSVVIVEKIPNLILLPNSQSYIKYGGTNFHWGPPGHLNNDYNHYGTVILVNAIQKIANNFRNNYPNVRLRINDMSLPLGGGFDIYGNWIEDIENRDNNNRPCVQSGHGHCTHRMGLNADISFRILDQYNNLVRINQEQYRILLQYITEFYGQPYIHRGNNEHFHLQ